MPEPCWPGIENAPPAFLRKLRAEAFRRGWDFDSLLGHISHESRFKPDAANPDSSARGLIQMLDATAREFAGVPSRELARMSHEEQIPGIVRYFSKKTGTRPLKGADFLLLGMQNRELILRLPRSHVLYPADSLAAKVNPYMQAEDGSITVGSVRDHWSKWERQAKGKCAVPDPEPKQSGWAGGSLLGMMLLGFVALKWAKKGKA